MYRVIFSTKAKKDLKRISGDPFKRKIFEKFANLLREGKPIPAEFKPHPLQGKYKDCLECHMKDDFLLIWMDPINMIIKIVRVGSHSELFE